MFYLLELRDYLLVKPEFLGPGFHEYCDDNLRQKVEGTFKEHAGIVIAVVEAYKADRGKLQEGTGLVMVPMAYKAVVLQLFKGEVVDCVCDEVTQLGFFGAIGPVRVFVSRSHLPQGWKYSEDHIDAGAGPAYVSEEGNQLIRVKSAVRVKLIATKQENDRLWAIGSCQEDFLGPRAFG
mmetsp:Transcript_22851/g.58444  ORF Transcript_22851/g.58444 Transcript_22851/m.58444 type:complete len:179 (-) Transcript_22851:86-622(-)